MIYHCSNIKEKRKERVCRDIKTEKAQKHKIECTLKNKIKHHNSAETVWLIRPISWLPQLHFKYPLLLN